VILVDTKSSLIHVVEALNTRVLLPGHQVSHKANLTMYNYGCCDVECWGIRNHAFHMQIARSFQLVNLNSKGSAAKPREPLSPFSFIKTYLLTGTLRHQQSNQISPVIQSVRVSVRSLGFLSDETPGANLTHPASHGLGFARGDFVVPNI
jgi:hypothetical protein